jgi:hypothetical protein
MTLYAAISSTASSGVIIALGTFAFLASTLEVALDLVVVDHQIEDP